MEFIFKGYDTLEFQADIPPTLTCINQHISNGTPACQTEIYDALKNYHSK